MRGLSGGDSSTLSGLRDRRFLALSACTMVHPHDEGEWLWEREWMEVRRVQRGRRWRGGDSKSRQGGDHLIDRLLHCISIHSTASPGDGGCSGLLGRRWREAVRLSGGDVGAELCGVWEGGEWGLPQSVEVTFGRLPPPSASPPLVRLPHTSRHHSMLLLPYMSTLTCSSLCLARSP